MRLIVTTAAGRFLGMMLPATVINTCDSLVICMGIVGEGLGVSNRSFDEKVAECFLFFYSAKATRGQTN